MNDYERRINEEWERYQKQKAHELYPNIMLIGPSGAGKSSLINRIFRGHIAEVSNVKPETEGYNNIYWGKDHNSSVNLIDTAGYELGKADTYYPEIKRTIDSGINGERVHIIWYCIPITNERVQDMDKQILDKLLAEPDIRKRICIVFTKCDQDSEDSEKANALKNALVSMGITIQCFETAAKEISYDLDLKKLIQWSAQAIDNEDLRNKFIAAQMADLDVKRETANKIIAAAAVTAGGIGAVPIPFSDAALLVPVQVGMTAKIIDIYGVSNLANISKSLLGSLVVSNLGKSLASSILKVIPVVGQVVGSVINAGVASAMTSAIGLAVSEICYNNVKSYLSGNAVAWDSIFSTDEFSNLVTTYFKQKK